MKQQKITYSVFKTFHFNKNSNTWINENIFYKFNMNLEISGVDSFVGTHVNYLDDGNGNLDSIFQMISTYNDNIHENEEGRRLISFLAVSNYRK